MSGPSPSAHLPRVAQEPQKTRIVRIEGLVGPCVVTLDEAALAEAVANHDATRPGDTHVLKQDERSLVTAIEVDGAALVLKEVRKGGPRRRLADAFRGSPARRAWQGAARLQAAGIATAESIAYLEQRVAGVPLRSILISKDLRPAVPATELAERGEGMQALVVDALCELAIELHRHGFEHGDLRAQHVFLGPEGSSDLSVPRLIDLEGLRVVAKLSDEARIDALAELNASLDDDLFPLTLRRQAFERYASALPFTDPIDAVQTKIAERSLERAHVWQGRGCAVVPRT